MKRIIPVLVISALAVVGCKSGNKSTTQANTIPSELTQQPLPPAPAAVPAPAPYEPAPAPVVTPAPVAPAPARTTAKAPKATATPAAAKPTSKHTYTVKKGDTLSEIAKANKTTVKKIVALNPGLNPNRILVGQKIKLP